MLHQDEGLSRRQSGQIYADFLSCSLLPFSVWPCICLLPLSQPCPAFCSQPAAHTEEDHQLPFEETCLASALEYFCLSLAR